MGSASERKAVERAEKGEESGTPASTRARHMARHRVERTYRDDRKYPRRNLLQRTWTDSAMISDDL